MIENNAQIEEITSHQPILFYGVSGKLRILLFAIFTGLALFVAEQTVNLIIQKEMLYPAVALSYALTLLIIGIVVVAAVGLFNYIYPGALSLRALTIIGIVYILISFVIMLWSVAAGRCAFSLSIIKPLLLLSSCLILYVIVGRLTRDGGFKGVGGAALALFNFLIIAGWAFFSPEMYYFDGSFRYWATALHLGLLTSINVKISEDLKVSLLKEIIGISLMLILVSIIHWGRERAVYGSRTPEGANHVSGKEFKVQRPNIILIVWDTVRRDHLSVYGYERATTPYLNEFAKESILYTNAVSVSPWTRPSHASMFTGLYPRSHGAHFFYRPEMDISSKDYLDLPDDVTTLAEILKEMGYQCGGISANHVHAGRGAGLDQGFDYFYDQYNPWYLYRPSTFDLNRALINKIKPWMPAHFYFTFNTHSPTAEQINSKSLKWLDSTGDDGPFFLFINFMDAHEPYSPPQRLINLFPGYQSELALIHPSGILYEIIGPEKERELTERERIHLVSEYDAELVYLDEQLKILMDEIKERGWYHDAMIVVTSDHGEYFGEHGLLFHNIDLYSEVLDIPLIIKYPGRTPSGVNTSVIENRDLFNIILNQAGFEKDIQSLEANPWLAAAELYRRGPKKINLVQFMLTKRAVLFDNFKFIASSDGADELYDIDADPFESINLLHVDSRAAEIGEKLTQQFLHSVEERGIPNQLHDLSKEEIEQLRALGYIK
jgi:arylsulfatase A-like enzyme